MKPDLPDRPESRPLPARGLRDGVISALTTAFAQDELTVEEFERRLDVAHRTHNPTELSELLTDLRPAILPAPPAGVSPATPHAPLPPAPAEVRDHQMHIAVMGGVERKGQWVPAQRNHVLVLMGGVSLDFREARLGPGVTEITIFCALGGVEIIVPPGIMVDAGGTAIMGGFEHMSSQTTVPNAPVLRINGLALMGGVEITIRNPGETAKDARRRLREERKRLRRGDR